MASEYINRNRLLRHLADWWLTESPTGNEILFINGEPQTTPVMKVIEECVKAVEEQLTADVVEVVHGEWEGKGFAFNCSECGYHEYGQTVDCAKAWWNFCPNCGAKMDGGK
mgnify:CR=1 FL=1